MSIEIKILISALALIVVSAGAYLTVKKIQEWRTFDPQVEYNKVMGECTEMIDDVVANCPAKSYSSYLLTIYYSLKISGLPEVSEERSVFGGPCPYETAGATEKVAIFSESSDYTRSFKAGEISEHAEGICRVSCSSNNCPKLTKSEQTRKECLYPIYLYADGSEDEETMEQVKKDCELRSKRTTVDEKGNIREEVWRECSVDYGSCDYVKVGEKESEWIASCCCSCDRFQDPYPAHGRVWDNSSGKWIYTISEDLFSTNLPPILEITESVVEVTEGEKVMVFVRAIDPEYENTTISYGEPLNEFGNWQTEIGDAGSYTAEITASDGEKTTQKKVKINVGEPLVEPEEIKEDEEEAVAETQDEIKVEVSVNNFSLEKECGGAIVVEGNISGDYKKVEEVTLLLNSNNKSVNLPVDYQLATGNFFLSSETIEPETYSYSLVIGLPDGGIDNAPSGIIEIEACPEVFSKDISTTNIGAFVKCEGGFTWVEVEGNLSGEDVNLVKDVKVLVDGDQITTGYHPTDNFWFIGSQYDMENKNYLYEVKVVLQDYSEYIISQGETTNQCL